MPRALQSFFQEKMPTRAIRSFKFGLQGVEKETKYFIRSEGNRNLKNDPYYTGSKAIFLDHRYKRIIREQRCLVLADAYLIGIEKNPFLVYLKDHKRPFGMAGLWNVIEDENGQKTHSFGILTVPANPLIRKLGYDRMPVITSDYQERRWLSTTNALSQVLAMLNPYPQQLMNAYPISEKIRDVENNDVSMVQPISTRIYSEKVDYTLRKKVKQSRDNDNLPSWGESVNMNNT